MTEKIKKEESSVNHIVISISVDRKQLLEKKLSLESKRRKVERKKKSHLNVLARGHLSKFIIMALVVWCSSVEKCETLQVATSRQMRCPDRCMCYDEYKEVYCENQGIRSMPTNIPNTAKTLVFSGNNLNSLKANNFKSVPKLTNLQLQRNRIYDISDTAFFRLNNLQSLDLSGNKLTRYPSTALGFLKNLKILNLRNNPITQIIAFQFGEMGGNLVNLDLGELRHLTYVSTNAFTELNNLEVLKMDSCNLLKIPSLSAMINLREINLSSNRFTQIRSEPFAGLTMLQRIEIDSCQIKEIELNAFSDLTSLEYLSLIRNNLTGLAPSVFKNNTELKTLNLKYNPWFCDCNIMSLSRYLSNKKVCVGNECPACEKPTSYKGRVISTLSRTSRTQCTSRNVEAVEMSYSVRAGQRVKIVCPIIDKESGYQLPYVKWFVPDGAKFGNKKYKSRVRKLRNGSLDFTRVKLKDEGKYTCSMAFRDRRTINGSVYLNVSKSVAMLSSTTTTLKMITTTHKIPSDRKQKNPIKKKTKPQLLSIATTSSAVNIPDKPQPTTISKTISTTSNLRSINNRKYWKITSTVRASFRPEVKRIQPKAMPPQNKESDAYTGVIIGCFLSLTLMAALSLLIFYKVKKKNDNLLRRSRSDLSENNCDSSIDPSENLKTAVTAGSLEVQSPEHARGSKSAMTHSVTGTWVAALPENAKQVKPFLPSTAICVLPPPIEEWNRMSANVNNKTDDLDIRTTDYSKSNNSSKIESGNALKSMTRIQVRHNQRNEAPSRVQRHPNEKHRFVHQAAPKNYYIAHELNGILPAPDRATTTKRPKSCVNFAVNNEETEHFGQATNQVRFKNDSVTKGFSNAKRTEEARKKNYENKRNVPLKVKSLERILNTQETRI